MTDHVASGVSFENGDASRLNALTLRRYFESFGKGDYLGMQSCLHPDVEFSDIGFELQGRKVGAMWHMIIANGIRVSSRDLTVDGQTGNAHWECDYEFRKDKDAVPRPVHNAIDSTFRFDNGLIREQHDRCDFWAWFEQAIGPMGRGAHLVDFMEGKVEQLLKR